MLEAEAYDLHAFRFVPLLQCSAGSLKLIQGKKASVPGYSKVFLKPTNGLKIKRHSLMKSLSCCPPLRKWRIAPPD
jgi:hypothetical protein